MDKSLILIVGAGASKDFGSKMPIGSELADRIEQSLNIEFAGGRPTKFDGLICSVLAQSVLNDKKVDAANKIRRSLHGQESIDDLLNDWRDMPAMIEVGKVAIAKVILEAERESGLAAGQNNDQLISAVSPMRHTWLGQVVRHFNPAIKRRHISEALNNVGFIVFNYDRCVERFLFAEIQAQAALNEDDASKVLANIPIIHPHGHLGPMFWNGSDPLVPFGDMNPNLISFAARNIKTYTEEDRDKESLNKISDLLNGAERAVLLGFSYHPENMRLLTQLGLGNVPEVWGGCLDPNKNRLAAAQRMLTTSGRSPRLYPMKCDQLLETYRQEILHGDDTALSA